MGDEMDMDLEVDMGTESEQKAPNLDTDSLSEAEYMEILGLEGMDAGGETTVEEAEEEMQESDKSVVFTERQRKKDKGRSPGENEQERMDPEQPGDAAEGRKEWHSESKVSGNRAVDGQQTIREIPLSGIYMNPGMNLSGMPIEQILEMQQGEQQEEHVQNRHNKVWDGEMGQEQEARAQEMSGYMQEVRGQEGELHECREPQMEPLQSQTQAANSTQKEEKPHQFKQGVDVIQPMSGVGNVLAQTVKHKVEDSDEHYQSGVRETKKYVAPVLDAVAVVGAKELSKGIKAELNKIDIASGQVYELIRKSELSMVDLADKKLLKEQLDKIEGLSAFQKKQIVKFRETAYDLMMVRDALEKQAGASLDLEKQLRAHLSSREFFDLRQQKTNELLKAYFGSSNNDVLKNVNPASMSEKRIKKLLKTREKNGFTDTDCAAIRLARRQMRYRESRIKIGRLLNIRRRIEVLKEYSYRADGTAAAGLQNIAHMAQITHAVYSVGKFGLKAGVVTASFVGKYTGAAYLLHKLGKMKREKAERLKSKAREAVKNSRPYRAANQKVGAAKAKVTEKLGQNSAVQKFKKMRSKVQKKAKAAAKKVNRIKAAARAAGKKIKLGKDMVLSPFRLLGKGISGLIGVFGKIKMVLLATAGIILAAYLIIVVLANAILSIVSAESAAALTAILTDNDNFIPQMTALLQIKVDAKRQDAMDIVEGTPKNPNVFEGHSIQKYGHPDADGNWVKGAEIIYVDGDGSIILNGRNNIKESIALAYVIMEGDFDSNTRARDDLILDLWELMNPAVTYLESDVYTCPHGCDSFDYECNSTEDYTAMSSYQADGVGFYGEIKAYSSYGDSYEASCDGCTDADNNPVDHGSTRGTGAASGPAGCSNYSVEYNCTGHSVTVCYGHKDVEVYVPVVSMEEMFASGTLPTASGKTYQTYLNSFEGWTADNQEWAMLLVNTDWFELYGIDPSGGTGYVAGSGMTPEEIAAITATYGDLDATRTAICSDAMGFVGQIPYYWGGKASVKDYAANAFNTTVTADYMGRDKKGLDCSGFVQWIIWRVTDVKIGASTGTITTGMTQISVAELQPGDLGLMAVPGSNSNHVGIFVGYNESGQALWCHENSSAGNVSVNNTTCFRYYYRLF